MDIDLIWNKFFSWYRIQ